MIHKVRIQRQLIIKLSLLGFLTATGISAQAEALFELETEVPRIAGAAVGALPDYLGSNDYEVGIAPFLRYQFEGSKRYVQLLGAEVTFNVLDHPNLRFGPLVNYHFGRDDDVEDEVVARMQEIDGTVEMGAFLDWFYVVEPGNPRHRLVAGGAFEQDVGNESDGLRGRISARYWRPATEAIDVYIGGGMQFADSDYVETYFGVDAADAAATGLPQFSPSGGANDVRLNLGALFYLSREWLLAASWVTRKIAPSWTSAALPIRCTWGREPPICGNGGLSLRPMTGLC